MVIGIMNGAVSACAGCGCVRVRLRVRERGHRASLHCVTCAARTNEYAGEHAVWLAEAAWARMPPWREAGGRPAAEQPARGGAETETGDERDPLELIARMLVGGGYRVPVAGRSTKGTLTSGDIAGALAMMHDPVERAAACAVATRADGVAIAGLAIQALRTVEDHLRASDAKGLALSEPADRWRLRLVIHAAAEELVWPERRRPYTVLAKEAKMRVASYMGVHKVAVQALQSALNGGRREFAKRLFSS
ncbi:hypothetical protein GGR77_001528 [Xanthomonas translucens]